MQRLAPFLLVIVAALGTLLGGALLYRAQRRPGPTAWQARLAQARYGLLAGHALGQPDAPVTLEEFGDLQCPPCRALSDIIDQLEKDHPDQVRVVFRQFPLAMHAHAWEAACALEAADLQGHFWEMHALLYREQANWAGAASVNPFFDAYADGLALDLARFHHDMQGTQVQARVASDQRRGTDLGVSKTPTIFLNGVSVPPAALRPEPLRHLVEAAITARSSR